MLPEELLYQTAKGDPAAFRQLYELFKDKVYNTCLSYLQHEGEAEEATQDVFVEVYHSAVSFEGKATVKTWIYRIAINKCLDRIRYKKRQKRFAYVASLFGVTGNLLFDPPSFEHPGVLSENKEKAKMLFAAMERLPANQRAAFVLKHIEGLSQKEVAEVLQLGEKAVESLLQRPKAGLRNELRSFYRDNEG